MFLFCHVTLFFQVFHSCNCDKKTLCPGFPTFFSIFNIMSFFCLLLAFNICIIYFVQIFCHLLKFPIVFNGTLVSLWFSMVIFCNHHIFLNNFLKVKVGVKNIPTNLLYTQSMHQVGIVVFRAFP